MLCLPCAAAPRRRAVAARPAPLPAPTPEFEAATKVEADLKGQMRVLIPLLEQLETFRAGYPLLDDPASVAPERAELRRQIAEAHAAFTETAEGFAGVRKRYQTLGLQLLLTGAGQDTAGQNIAQSMELEAFSSEVKDLRKKVKVVLHYDDIEYLSALTEQARRRKLARLQWGGGVAALVLLASAGAWGWRRRAPGRQPALGPPTGPSGEVLPGTVVGGNYNIVRLIGKGGMGLVYEATDEALRRRVAVKQMRAEFRSSPRDLEAFLTEARLVAALKHPNIVDIHAIVSDGNEVFLVFEFVDGEPLHQVLQRVPRLALPPTVRLLREIGLALDCAHAQKIIHRDLKPANVMITPQGGVKVMDFGLAHQAHISVARQTRAESWGTLPYMSPEQELGTVSRESDLYSMGVVLYETLTGRLPFPGPNYLAQKREMHFVPPSQAAPDLPRSLDIIVGRALHTEPARRYHSAAELVAELDALMAGGV